MPDLFTYLFLAIGGMIVGYWLTYRDQSQEEAARGRLKQENKDLRRSLQASQVAADSLEEKYGRQRGQLNVLQQLCDDWSSSREISERERAQMEADLSAKSSRVSEVEAECRDEKQKRIGLEDRLHSLTQEVLHKTAEVEAQWRGKHSEAEMALNKSLVDIVSVKADNEKVSDALHSANARIAELESEIKSHKELVEAATANATGLKQEYVSLETGLKSTNDQLKQVRAEVAKANSQKETALKATVESEKRLAVAEQDCKKLDELNCTLQQKLETTQKTLTVTQEQLAKVTEQRDQSLEAEKAAGVIASGLQQRLDNQESTIHLLRQSQDDALENLKHELKVRSEMEAKFDAKADNILSESGKMREEYEAQIKALRQGQEDALENLKHELKVRSEMEAKFDARNVELRAASEKMMASYEAKLDAVREEAEKLNADLAADYESKINALRAELTESESRKTGMVAEYEAKLNELREHLSQQKSVHDECTRDLKTQLEQQRTEVDLERVRLTAESQSIVSRCSKLESDASTYTESIVKLDAKREQLQHDLQAARKQMQSQLKQDSETIGELQRERNDLRTEVDQLHVQMAQMQETISSHTAFTTELQMNQTRVTELERVLAQRDQESKRLRAQANELERLRQRYQDARDQQEKLQLQLDEFVARQISSESDRASLMARIGELEARLGASLETIEDLRKERALVLATLADQRTAQEPEATIISFTQSMAPKVVVEEAGYDEEYGGRMRRDANRGLVFMEAPESCDDLKRISGIAEVLEKRLNDFGIYTFKQVMDWLPEEIEEFSRLLAFRDRIERDDWQGQARFFYNQKRQGVRAAA